MAARKDDSSFLQPILSVLGLIISSFSAIAPLFAQAQLSKFFIDDRLSLPASIVSVVFGILLSWYLISINGYVSISIGIKKERGAGYPQPWKEINNKNVIPIVLIVSTFLFFYLLCYWPENRLHLGSGASSYLCYIFYSYNRHVFSAYSTNKKSIPMGATDCEHRKFSV